MELNTILIACFFFLLYIFIKYVIFKYSGEPKNFPKGPKSYFPIFGGMIKCGREPYKHFLDLQKRWGNLFAFDFGPYRVIVLNDYKIIREALSILEFNGRRNYRACKYKQADHKANGFMFLTADADWHEQRRFTLKNLRDSGFGRSSIQNLIEVEIDELMMHFSKISSQEVTISTEFIASVMGTLRSVLMSHRTGHDDPIMMDVFNRIKDDFGKIMFLITFPWLFDVEKYFKNFITKPISDYVENSKYTLNFMRKYVKEHQETYQENSNRDFIDTYLTKINTETNPESTFYQDNGENNLTTVLLDLFQAGADSTSNALSFLVHILSLHPHVQEKMFKEINTKIGLNRRPGLSDRPNLIYCEAVIFEMQRFATVVPFVINEAMEDIKNFHGYDIPKGTIIYPNFYSANHDPNVWDKPEEFRPERFLSEDEQTKVKHEAFMPFGIGKRQCPGETLARDTLFLFTMSIFQKFFIVPGSGNIPKKVGNVCGATNRPISFPVIFKERF